MLRCGGHVPRNGEDSVQEETWEPDMHRPAANCCLHHVLCVIRGRQTHVSPCQVLQLQ